MKKAASIFIGAFSVSLLAGCATTEKVGNLENRVEQLENQVRILETRPVSNSDTTADVGYYCYMNGVKYTEGAVVGSQKCKRTGIIVGGDPKLQWRPNN